MPLRQDPRERLEAWRKVDHQRLTRLLSRLVVWKDPCGEVRRHVGGSHLPDLNWPCPVGALGMETHKGTWSFRHVISINMCYDQCGLMNITISHKIYCEFGVYVLDVPTSPISPITENWYSDGTPVLIQDSLWAWVDIPTPTCGSEYTLPAPDLGDCVLAAAYTKTWGRAYTNCGGASSFTRTFPAACAATGLTLNGTGDECTC